MRELFHGGLLVEPDRHVDAAATRRSHSRRCTLSSPSVANSLPFTALSLT
jgi:hypothetical protein